MKQAKHTGVQQARHTGSNGQLDWLVIELLELGGFRVAAVPPFHLERATQSRRAPNGREVGDFAHDARHVDLLASVLQINHH
jgi:hypothetical protein